MTNQFFVPSLQPPRSAYIHIPFCRSKCFYCDFTSYAGLERIFDDYVGALITEINRAEPGPALDSVYLGGGTPTILSPDALERILDALQRRFGIVDRAEITLEANPGTVDPDGLVKLRRIGFNRLSIGVQSFDDRLLALIGRIHTSIEARTAFTSAREAGFENISIDLMYALPEQSIADWQGTLESALVLHPEHISLYELTIEEGTVFGNLRKRCQLQLPDEDMQIEMYLTAIRNLTASGYEHYEISNFALPNRRSRHNQVYWRNEAYFGFGAGATSYIAGIRSAKRKDPAGYIAAINAGESAVETSEAITGREAMGETIMLGLRMLEGIELDRFEQRFMADLRKVYSIELADLTARDLVELTETNLRLTQSGLLAANEVASEFL